jgi:hypothetical protein
MVNESRRQQAVTAGDRLGRGANVADVDDTPVAVDDEDNPQVSDPRAPTPAATLQRLGMPPIRVLGDLVHARQYTAVCGF